MTDISIHSRESVIFNLSRNNDMIKSIFHFKKSISFIVVQIAMQKIRLNDYKNNQVIITKDEISKIITGKDKSVGINKLITLIRDDLEQNDKFNSFEKHIGLKDVRETLIDSTALTDDVYENLYIKFKESLFKKFQLKRNYTNQETQQFINCENDLHRINLYTICHQHAKEQDYLKVRNKNYEIKPLYLCVKEAKMRLNIKNNQYKQTSHLTLQIKRVCEKINKKNDINLFIETVKSRNKIVGYNFYPTLKNLSLSKKDNTEVAEIIFDNYETIKKQLQSWKIGNQQIKLWCYGFTIEQLSDAINQTLSHANTNHSGYLYKILGDGKPEAREKNQTNEYNKTAEGKLKSIGFTKQEAISLQQQYANLSYALIPVVDQVIRSKHKSIEYNKTEFYKTIKNLSAEIKITQEVKL